MDNRKISICVTSRNEYAKLINSFSEVLYDERVSQIIILDDLSEEDIYYRIEQWYEYDAPKEKVRLAQNTKSIGEKLSERTAIILSDNEWILSITPEIIIEKIDLDQIFNQDWDKLENTDGVNNGNYFVNRDEYLRAFKMENK